MSPVEILTWLNMATRVTSALGRSWSEIGKDIQLRRDAGGEFTAADLEAWGIRAEAALDQLRDEVYSGDVPLPSDTVAGDDEEERDPDMPPGMP